LLSTALLAIKVNVVSNLMKSKQGLIIFTKSDNGTDAFAEILVKYLGENGQGIIEVEMKK